MSSIVNSTSNLFISNIMQINQRNIDTSLNRLASGKRVMTPKDDVGAYFQGTQFSRRAGNVSLISQNLADNISALKVAESAYEEIKGLLEDAAELALQGSTEDDNDIRANLATEVDNIFNSIDDLVTNTHFNGTTLLNNDYTITIQLDEDLNTSTYTTLNASRQIAGGLNLGANYHDAPAFWGADGSDNTEKTNAGNYYAAIMGVRPDNGEASGLARVDRNLLRISTIIETLEKRQATLNSKAANYEAAASTLLDVDEAKETTLLSSAQIRQQAGAYFLSQSNNYNTSVISLFFR